MSDHLDIAYCLDVGRGTLPSVPVFPPGFDCLGATLFLLGEGL